MYIYYLGFFVLLAVWVFFDARRRQASAVLWALGALLLGPLLVPVYFADRPLLTGEIREGGRAWNILKNFAVLWTLLMVVFFVITMFAFQDDRLSSSASAIGAVVGIGFFGALWFFPMFAALVLGFFLKKSTLIERGPPIKKEPPPAP